MKGKKTLMIVTRWSAWQSSAFGVERKSLNANNQTQKTETVQNLLKKWNNNKGSYKLNICIKRATTFLPQWQRTLQNFTMMCGCFTAAGPGRLVKAEGEIKVKKYQEFLEENLIQSENKLWLGAIFLFHVENIMEHLKKTTQKIF